MTCKDCLHGDVCVGYVPSDLDRDVWQYCREGKADQIPDIEERCSSFKDRTKYVEVVRCKDCAYWDYQGVGSSSLKRYGGCKKWYPCGNEQHSCYEDDFCSCGVKREEADNGY